MSNYTDPTACPNCRFFREEMVDAQQKLSVGCAQLDAANQRIAELEIALANERRAYENTVIERDAEGRNAEVAERKLATARSETIQECADWITETELALPIAWHIGTKDELVKKFALCLASCLRMETLDKHCYLCSEETLDSARRDKALAQVEQPPQDVVIDTVPNTKRRDWVRERFVNADDADQPTQRLPSEDPPFDMCQCPACVALRTWNGATHA